MTIHKKQSINIKHHLSVTATVFVFQQNIPPGPPCLFATSSLNVAPQTINTKKNGSGGTHLLNLELGSLKGEPPLGSPVSGLGWPTRKYFFLLCKLMSIAKNVSVICN